MIINENGMTNQYINVYTLTKQKIYLPIFQREFSWKEAQTTKILENIDDMIAHNLYLSKHIYLLDFIGFIENNNMKLADGQQRIITLSILIRCVNEVSQKQGLSLNIDNFDIEYDNDEYQKKWESFTVDGKIIAPFKKVYLALHDYIEEKSNYLPEIVQILKSNIFIYLKMAQTADDAFDVFEQINTGGKPLSKDEIIKTIIHQYQNKYGIELECEEKDLKSFLVSYYKYKDNSVGKFDTLAIMSFLDKYVVDTKDHFKEFSQYIKDAKATVDSPIRYIASLLNRDTLMDMVYIYSANKIDIKSERQIIEKVFLPLFMQCSVFTLSGVNPGGKVKSFLDNIASMVKSNKSADDILKEILLFAENNKDVCQMSFDDFTEALQGPTKENIMKALLLMDIINSNTSGTFIPKMINLEHIYPQKPSTVWGQNGWPMNVDDQNRYIHNIGNYLILNEQINKKIQNNYITDKRKEYEKIIPKDIILQTKSNTVDFDEFEKGKSYILRRQREIAEHIYNTYQCAKMFIRKPEDDADK